jgi:hypothetical protein
MQFRHVNLKYFNLKYIESRRIELRHIVTDNINQMMTISKSPIRILIIIFNLVNLMTVTKW